MRLLDRDISWLAFNARVLQEAHDPSVNLRDRIRFLGIFSNNLDEFFRVRVATLRRLVAVQEREKKYKIAIEDSAEKILDQIHIIALKQQKQFNLIWSQVLKELKRNNIHIILDDRNLKGEQKRYIERYFIDNVRSRINPLMLHRSKVIPYLSDQSLYLGIVMKASPRDPKPSYALIEIPPGASSRFIQLPSSNGKKYIILLEDIIRFNLPRIFSHFRYKNFKSHVFKITKDAEIDLDQELSLNYIERIERGIKNRRKGKTVRFVYDIKMDKYLLKFIRNKLHLTRNNIIPGGKIHNFKHFMEFPNVFKGIQERPSAIVHPQLRNSLSVTDNILKQDILLHFPYHHFDPLIDLLRESAVDPKVRSIKLTVYRVADDSKILNALINAARNGKQVTVMLEIKARFDEKANLDWKEQLEEEGIKVLLGLPNKKVHCKLCVIEKNHNKESIRYGFVSTGNFNEKTARHYTDHCLLTSSSSIMKDINHIFESLDSQERNKKSFKKLKTLIASPYNMRSQIYKMINKEIEYASKGKPSSIILKMNSLSDPLLIKKLFSASKKGVRVQLIIRGICCVPKDIGSTLYHPIPRSIVDQYLEHGRVWIFGAAGRNSIFISSADWMVRNLDHRIEVACPILDPKLKAEIYEIIFIQLNDNQKARILDYHLKNAYYHPPLSLAVRSQNEIFDFLSSKNKASYLKVTASD